MNSSRYSLYNLDVSSKSTLTKAVASKLSILFSTSSHHLTFYMLPFKKCHHILIIQPLSILLHARFQKILSHYVLQPLSNLQHAAFQKMLSHYVHSAVIHPNRCYLSKKVIIFCSPSHYPTYYMLLLYNCYDIMFIHPLSNLLQPSYQILLILSLLNLLYAAFHKKLSNLLHAAFQKMLLYSVHPAIIQPTICCISQNVIKMLSYSVHPAIIQPTIYCLSKNVIIFCSSSHHPTYYMLPFKKCYHILFIQSLSNLLHPPFIQSATAILPDSTNPVITQPTICCLSQNVIIFCSSSHYPTYYMLPFKKCYHILFIQPLSNLIHAAFQKMLSYSVHPAIIQPTTCNLSKNVIIFCSSSHHPTYYMLPFKKCYHILFIQPLSNLLYAAFQKMLSYSVHPAIIQPTICCLSKNVITICSSSHYPTYYMLPFKKFYHSCSFSHNPTYYMLPFKKFYHNLFIQPSSNLLHAAFQKMLSQSVHPAIIQPTICCLSKNFIAICSSSHYPTYYMLPFKKFYHNLFIQLLSNLLYAAFQKMLSQSVHPAII